MDSFLSFENIFFNMDYKILSSLAIIRNGKVYINRPNIEEVYNFCKEREYNLVISEEIKNIYDNMFTIHIKRRKDESFILSPKIQNNSELYNDKILNRLSAKISNKIKTEFLVDNVYVVYILLNYLKKKKYKIIYDNSLNWLDDKYKKYGKIIEKFENNIQLLPHQKKTY